MPRTDPADAGAVPGDGQGRLPSIRDVAQLAGVSHQTVSRVLNDHPNVRERTRLKVLTAVREMGYRPNHLARALATGRSGTVGVVTLNSALYGPTSMLYAVEEAAREAGFGISITSLRSIDRSSVFRAIERLRNQGVEGLIVIAPVSRSAEPLDQIRPETPLVSVDSYLSPSVPAVGVDQSVGARLATEHLLAQGHRTVWHISGPRDWLDSRGRIEGWKATLESAGCEVPPPISGDWSAQSGYDAGQLLARMPEVTAVFAANDHMALGLLHALREHRRRVPEDVSVVGYDDVPEAAYYLPPLTTIRQDFDQVGRAALRLLLDQLESGSSAPSQLLIEPVLVVRSSTTTARLEPGAGEPTTAPVPLVPFDEEAGMS